MILRRNVRKIDKESIIKGLTLNCMGALRDINNYQFFKSISCYLTERLDVTLPQSLQESYSCNSCIASHEKRLKSTFLLVFLRVKQLSIKLEMCLVSVSFN